MQFRLFSIQKSNYQKLNLIFKNIFTFFAVLSHFRRNVIYYSPPKCYDTNRGVRNMETISEESAKQTIGLRIMQRRKQVGMKQKELAEALDLTVNQVSNIENGVSFPRMGSFLKICSILQASPDYFLSGTIHHNISENICDMLSLCSVEEQQIIWLLLDIFLHRNSKKDLEKQ